MFHFHRTLSTASISGRTSRPTVATPTGVIPLHPLQANSKSTLSAFLSCWPSPIGRAAVRKTDRCGHCGEGDTPCGVFSHKCLKGAGHHQRGCPDRAAACRPFGTSRRLHHRRGRGDRREMRYARAQFQEIPQRQKGSAFHPQHPRKLHQVITHLPLGIIGTLAFLTEMLTLPFMPKCRKCQGVNPKLKSRETFFFIEETIAFSAVVIAVHHCYGSAVPSVQWRHGNYAIRKFLSILGNFPSRISFRYAENVPNMPKRSTPLETPERLNRKPYTPIAPQLKLVRL